MNEMKEIYGKLTARLCKKGLRPVEIPLLIKDVSRIVENSRDHRRTKLDSRLNTLGWRTDLIDDFTFELIVYLLENPHSISRQENFEYHRQNSKLSQDNLLR